MPQIVVDSVHGDIKPSDLEWKVIDTPSFQRLRKLKQLQMAHLVYPNAVHTRFIHSLGVLNIMIRVLGIVDPEKKTISEEDQTCLRLSMLLHDVGHYPYSHLLELVDSVILTEEHLSNSQKDPLSSGYSPYPDHEDIGQVILENQSDLVTAIGGKDRIVRMQELYKDKQLGKLIHSSLDMDRMDYLIRDSQATGVPYGNVDINYLLNHIRMGKDGTIGISHKAMAAAEHLLLARSFVFRVVCQHKTVYGFESAARQLARRLRDRAQSGSKLPSYGIPKDGDEIMSIARSNRIHTFADSFLDNIFAQAIEDSEDIVRKLAKSIVSRRPPRLIWEKSVFEGRDDDHNIGALFKETCKTQLAHMAKEAGIDVKQFLICESKPIGFESRGAAMSSEEVKKVAEAGEESDMIKVFPTPAAEQPKPIVDLRHSVLHEIGGHVYKTYRLYIVHPEDDQDEKVKKLKEITRYWKIGKA